MEKLWFVFGVLAMFAAVGNVSTILTKRRAEGFRFASLSLTALTV